MPARVPITTSMRKKKKRTSPVSKLLRPVKEPLRFKKPSSPSENTKYMNLLNKAIKEAEEEMKKKGKANIAQKNNKSSPSNENKRYEEWLKKEVKKYKKIINNEKRETNRQGNTIMKEASPIGS